jgi:hypothetical protein
LKPGHTAAVCLTVDDVHPTAADGDDGVGAIGRRALDHLTWLLDRHPRLRVTLFCTPDWRSRSVQPTRRWTQRMPGLRRWSYATRILPRGTLRFDRHPLFAAALRAMPRVEFALHGLHHVRRGPQPVGEFQELSFPQCRRRLVEARRIMDAAGIEAVAGFAPPNWSTTPALLDALVDQRFQFVTSARDLETAVTPAARTAGSGMQDRSLIHPEWIAGRPLVHVTTNFQASCPIRRALDVVEHGGLLALKAHLLKRLGAYEAMDGLDAEYVGFLDRVLSDVEDRSGGAIWWTTMGEVAARMWEQPPSGA